MDGACPAAASPPSPRSPRSRCVRRPRQAPPTARGPTSFRRPTTSPSWPGHALPAQPAACRARRGRPGRERDAHHRLRGLLAADGRAGLLRPRVARRRHARRAPDRRRLPRRRRRVGRGREHRLGPGHARHRALDGHRLDGQPRPPREPAQRRLHPGRPGSRPGRPPTRRGAPPTPPTSGPARRRRRPPTRTPRQRRRQVAQEGQAPGAVRSAASVRRGARSAKPRSSSACVRSARVRAAEHPSIAFGRVSYPRPYAARVAIAALLALAVALGAPAALRRARRRPTRPAPCSSPMGS